MRTALITYLAFTASSAGESEKSSMIKAREPSIRRFPSLKPEENHWTASASADAPMNDINNEASIGETSF